MITVILSEERSEGLIRRTAKSLDKEVWWEIKGPIEVLPPPLDLHDMAALCFVFHAMHKGEDLHVAGPVSRSMLENLEDLVASWVNWCPELYKSISIFCDEEVIDKSRTLPDHADNLAIAAFSGGLDSTFTAWRHHNTKVRRKNRKLLLGALIHGFDIPLENVQAFEISATSANETLRSIGLPLVTIQTNWRSELCTSWEMEFGDGIATCLMNWQGAVDTALIGSDMDYRRLVYPWGGSPMTYSMFSNDGFKVIYDGGEFARTEKAEGIADWTEGLSNLRVCWDGPMTGKNCGTCEKCIRTKLNFLAVGAALPPTLPGMPSLFSIFRLRTNNEQQIALMNDIVEMATRRQVEGLWLQALKFAVLKNKIYLRVPVVKPMRLVWWRIKVAIIKVLRILNAVYRSVKNKIRPNAQTSY